MTHQETLDMFAARAMQAMCRNGVWADPIMAERAYEIASAMMAERNKRIEAHSKRETFECVPCDDEGEPI